MSSSRALLEVVDLERTDRESCTVMSALSIHRRGLEGRTI